MTSGEKARNPLFRRVLRRMSTVMSELAEWHGFYAVVGSAAGALIGLQFVVITLVAAMPRIPSADAGAAFATPTIVHFSTVLLLATLLHAPWHTTTIVAALLGLVGVSGFAYAVVVSRRMRKQAAYQPELEDWIFHCFLPLAAYVILALSPLAAFSHTREALFGVGAAALLLLFTGIHNAWDSIAYQVFVAMRARQKERHREDRPGEETQ
jgi:hypothetical protein